MATNPWQMNYGASNATDTANWAYGQGKGLLGDMQTPQFPGYTGDQKQAPVQMGYGVNFSQAPQYQGVQALEGGDYDAVQAAMMQPIEQGRTRALGEADSRFAGSGLYGSVGQGMHSGAVGDIEQAYNAAAANAVMNRYQLQGQDLNRQMANQENIAKYGLLGAERQQAYDTNRFGWDYSQAQQQRDFANQQVDNRFAYDATQYDQGVAEQQRALQNILALASGTQPGMSYNLGQQGIAAQRDAANQSADAQNTAGWLGAAGGLLGGALSSDGLWDWIGSW